MTSVWAYSCSILMGLTSLEAHLLRRENQELLLTKRRVHLHHESAVGHGEQQCSGLLELHTHTHTLLLRQKNLHFYHEIYFFIEVQHAYFWKRLCDVWETNFHVKTHLINVWKCSRKLNSESWPWKRSRSLKQRFTLTSNSTRYYWSPLSFWRCSSDQGNHA